MPDWWKKGIEFPYDNKNFIKIIDFYLFNCPVKIVKNVKKNNKDISKVTMVSKRAICFENKSWSSGNVKTFIAVIKENKYFVCTDDVKVEREKIEAFEDKKEYIVFKKNSDLNQLKSIFYSIRNSLAHGSFSVVENNGNPIYYFENEHNGLKAQICLKETTLMHWITVFNSTPENIRNIRNQRTSRNKKEKKYDKSKFNTK